MTRADSSGSAFRRLLLMLVETLRQAKRAIIATVGFTLLSIGIVMLVTPGPGWAVILLGLGVLGVEFVWARRVLKRLKKAAADVADSIRATARRREPQPRDTTVRDRVDSSSG
jgi:uncharacterized protein (TIGR02611 family)